MIRLSSRQQRWLATLLIDGSLVMAFFWPNPACGCTRRTSTGSDSRPPSAGSCPRRSGPRRAAANSSTPTRRCRRRAARRRSGAAAVYASTASRMTAPTERPWRDRTCLPRQGAPADRTRGADPETRRRSAARRPCRDRSHHPLPKITQDEPGGPRVPVGQVPRQLREPRDPAVLAGRGRARVRRLRLRRLPLPPRPGRRSR